MSGISINPAQVTNAPGLFSVTTDGYVQGTALSDPAIRNQLVQGLVAPGVTVPLYGGMGITESIVNPLDGNSAIGSELTLATAVANLTGFTVFDQSTAMYNSPQSPVPLAPSGGGNHIAGGFINFYRLGSGARIAVACSQSVAAAFQSNPVNTLAYWDYTNQVLLSAPGGGAIPVKVIAVDAAGHSKIVVYNTGTGFATWNDGGYCAIILV